MCGHVARAHTHIGPRTYAYAHALGPGHGWLRWSHLLRVPGRDEKAGASSCLTPQLQTRAVQLDFPAQSELIFVRPGRRAAHLRLGFGLPRLHSGRHALRTGWPARACRVRDGDARADPALRSGSGCSRKGHCGSCRQGMMSTARERGRIRYLYVDGNLQKRLLMQRMLSILMQELVPCASRVVTTG